MKYPLLRELIRVMKAVAIAEKPVRMAAYFVCPPDLSGDNAITAACNTPGCIAGYGRIDEKVCELLKIPTLAEDRKQGFITSIGDVSMAGTDIFTHLNREIGHAWAKSVLAGQPDDRYTAVVILKSNPIAKTLLRKNPVHLRTNNVNADDTVEYMELLLSELEKHDE